MDADIGDIKTSSEYIESEDTLVIRTEYDNRAVIAANMEEKAGKSQFGKYRGDMVHVGRIHLGDIERLKNEGFNLLSPDPEEVKRALLHIQSNEKHMLTVEGTPIAKQRKVWV
jgi:hypothetical protein